MSNIVDLAQIKASRDAQAFGETVINGALNMDNSRSVDAIQFVLSMMPDAKIKRSAFNDYNSDSPTSFDNEMLPISSSDFLRVTQRVGFTVSIDEKATLPTLKFYFDAGAPVYTIEFPNHVDPISLKDFYGVIAIESENNHNQARERGKALFKPLNDNLDTRKPALETEALNSAINLSTNIHTPDHIEAILSHASNTPMSIDTDKENQTITLNFSDNKENAKMDFSNIDVSSFSFVSLIMKKEVGENNALFDSYRKDISKRMHAAAELVQSMGGFEHDVPETPPPSHTPKRT